MANLTQLRMLEDLNGFLLVDKPAGIPFATVVKTVKRNFNLVKVGHGGSLDAMASGLLVLIVGDANKFANDLMSADRSYEGTMKLGLETNTHDIYGEKVGGSADAVSSPDLMEKVQSVLPEFKGDVFQTESRFCSIRREGSAAYEIADTGDHSQFMAHVYRLKVERSPEAQDVLSFETKVSKAVLVKTLVNDFGKMLGCGAALATIRRTQLGKFSVADAIPYDKLLATGLTDFASCVLPVAKAYA